MLLVLNGNIIGYCYKLEYGSDKYLYQYYVPTRHVDLSTLLGYTPGYFTLPDVPTAAPLKVMNDKERRVSAEYEFIRDELPLAYIIDDNV